MAGVSVGRSAIRSPKSWTPGCWSGRSTSGSTGERLPEKRTIVEFDFTGPRAQRVWLLLEPSEVSVCVTPPGFDADLILRADLMFFYRLWLGHTEYETALRCGAVVVDGPSTLARQLPQWLMWSPMAGLVRERTRGMTQPDGVAGAGAVHDRNSRTAATMDR